MKEVINFLLLHKADVNFEDRWGKSPMAYAQDDVEMVEIAQNMAMDHFTFRNMVRRETSHHLQVQQKESGPVTPLAGSSQTTPTFSRQPTRQQSMNKQDLKLFMAVSDNTGLGG